MSHSPEIAYPAVGGPCHGKMFRHDRSAFEVATFESQERPIFTHDLLRQYPVVIGERYRLRSFEVSYGAITMECFAWCWSEADPEDLIRMAIGLVVASAITDPQGVKWDHPRDRIHGGPRIPLLEATP